MSFLLLISSKFASSTVCLYFVGSNWFSSKLSFINLCEAGLISFAYTTLIPSSSLMNLIVRSPLADKASTILAPSNFYFSFLVIKITFFLKHVDVSLHNQNCEVPVKYLNRVVEDLIFNKLILLILFDILCVDFSFSFHKQLFVSLLNDCFPLVIDLLFLHFFHEQVPYKCWTI